MAYKHAFPDYPAPRIFSDGLLYGVFRLGQNYSNVKGYYGEYPRSYLTRMNAMFSDCIPTLHLFSGSVEDLSATTFDVNPEPMPGVKPNVVGNAEELSKYFGENHFQIIYADPPYSIEDAKHYGVSLVNRKKVVNECHIILQEGGFLLWLDQVVPMYRKDKWTVRGYITVIRSTNQRIRVVTIFQKGKPLDKSTSSMQAFLEKEE